MPTVNKASSFKVKGVEDRDAPSAGPGNTNRRPFLEIRRGESH
jgi:hypothetical protein